MKIPVGDSVVKVVNAIIKHYGGTRAARIDSSNPYSKWRVLDVNISDKNAMKLKWDLSNEGWSLKSGGHYANSTGSVSIRFHSGEKPFGGWLSVVGFKKAKASTLPYYD